MIINILSEATRFNISITERANKAIVSIVANQNWQEHLIDAKARRDQSVKDAIKPVILRLIDLLDQSNQGKWSPHSRSMLVRFLNILAERSCETIRDVPPPFPEIANFRNVTQSLFRGSLPTEEGFTWLFNTCGVRTVVNLMGENPMSPNLANFPQVKHFAIPIKDGSTPNNGQVKQFLGIVDDPANSPTYVHCRGGMGRTGVLTACHLISLGTPTTEAMDKALIPAETPTMNVLQKEFLRRLRNPAP